MVVLAFLAITTAAQLFGYPNLPKVWFVRLVAMWLVYLALAGVALVATRSTATTPAHLIGLSAATPPRQVLVAIAVMVGLLALVVGIPAACGVPFADIVGPSRGGGAVLAMSLLTSILVVGPVEEFCFRGWLLGELQTVVRPWLAVVIQAVLFGVWHYPASFSLLQVGVTTLIGAALGLVRWKVPAATVLALGLGHGLYDATLTIIAGLA